MLLNSSGTCLMLVAGIMTIASMLTKARCAHIGLKSMSNSGSHFLSKLSKLADDEEDFKVCRTELCKKTANELIKSMNESVDPCEDFYEFACGGWISRHPVPPTEAHWNQFDLINEKLDFQLKEIFEEEDGHEDPFPVTAAKQAYKTCADEERVEKEGLDPLIELLDEYGGWPMALPEGAWDEKEFDWQGMAAESTRRFAVASILFAYVYLDRKNSSRSVITLDQPSLVLPRSMLTEPMTYGKQIEAYRHWVASSAFEVSRSLRDTNLPASVKKKSVPKSRITVEAFNLVEFEVELAKITSASEERRDSFRLYNPMSLKTLQKWTDSAAIETSYGRIKWYRFLNVLLKDETTVGVNERIIVREVDYVFRLMALIDRTPLRIVANYLHWRIVKSLSRETSQRMRELAFDFDRVLSGIKEDQPLWRDCIVRIGGSLSFATGYQYVRRYFDVYAKKSAEEMVGHIRDAFKEEMERLTWMDSDTREAARQKADAMAQFIGYPDWFNNRTAIEEHYRGLIVGPSHFQNVISLTTFLIRKALRKLRHPPDRNEWTTNPAVVNAFYNPQKNSITFPAGILQPPFFTKGRIEALNYGSIGVVIGHEITHGFDDMGRQSDLHGNLAQWWSESTIQTYLKKAQCFIDQYGSYRVPELDNQLGTEVLANGVITQGENIADNGGIRQAFLAYHRFVQKHGREPRLIGLEKYTPEQLFYLGFATVWCESTTPESLLQEVLSDPHSLHRLRVRGSLSNSEDFSRTFHCKPGSSMSPSEKCMLW